MPTSHGESKPDRCYALGVKLSATAAVVVAVLVASALAFGASAAAGDAEAELAGIWHACSEVGTGHCERSGSQQHQHALTQGQIDNSCQHHFSPTSMPFNAPTPCTAT